MLSIKPFQFIVPILPNRGMGSLLLALLVCALVLTPIVSLLIISFQGFGDSEVLASYLENWQHLWKFVIAHAAKNTLIILGAVGLLSSLIGLFCAWLVTVYQFRGRSILVWALLLPLAMPTYIIAYAYVDFLHPLGPLQEGLRALFGYSSAREWRLPDVRGISLVIILLAFVLYPYVYLSTRAMFLAQGANLIEVAKTLGASRWRILYTVILPNIRPALAIGVTLVLFECLNDIGAMEILSVQTLTTAVYTTWVTKGDIVGASQIAMTTLLIVLVCVAIERSGRAPTHETAKVRPLSVKKLRGGLGFLAFFAAALPVLIGFVIPFGYLSFVAINNIIKSGSISTNLITLTQNTVLLAATATIITLILGFIVAWSMRKTARVFSNFPKLIALVKGKILPFAGIGYAIPGAVLAIGLLTPLIMFDLFFGEFWQIDKLILMGSMLGVSIALAIRFLAIAIGNLEAGFTRFSPNHEPVARLLGAKGFRLLTTLHLPILRPALISATLLIFVDIMKELPIILILRPLNTETLATWIYANASRGVYEEGAFAAVIIVLVGLLPVIMLQKLTERKNK